MNENNTLFELLMSYRVEIPILQRDYAQGRLDTHAETVRRHLLKDIKSAILGTQQVDLGFVYGKVNDGKFIPVDGQQRLTTLFLLHVYAFRNKDDSYDSRTALLEKFTYETRVSSRNFLEKFVEHREEIFKTAKPSEEIKDSVWFITGWKHDPTIQSALVMLDAIHNEFKDISNLATRLAEPKSKPVVFKFLGEATLAMEDGLYLKLNARGLPLSAFENFKARLLGRLKKSELGVTEDFRHNFERKLDCEWTDLFWSKYKESFDKSYLIFWGILLLNHTEKKNNFDQNWADTFDCDGISLEVFETASYTLDFIYRNRNSEAADIISTALNDQKYPNRVSFHAITMYLYKAKGQDTGSLKEWLRIIKNLTLNSVIDRDDGFADAIAGINGLAGSYNGLLEHFCQDKTVTGFNIDQIKEERQKAKIIRANKDFAEAIYKAEQHPYFKGQIRSAFYMMSADTGLPDFEAFKQYWNKISELFGDTGPKCADDVLRRALLTLGDYTMPVKPYNTLCVDKPEEATSMKRLFTDQCALVKILLDKLNSSNVERELQDMISNSDIPKNEWRYCLIHNPELFKPPYMKPSFLRVLPNVVPEGNGEFLLLPNKSSGGHNWEIFAATLYLRLKELQAAIRPELGDGRYGDRYLELKLTEKVLKIQFKDKKFQVHNVDVKENKENLVFETKSDDPISEAAEYLKQQSALRQVTSGTSV